MNQKRWVDIGFILVAVVLFFVLRQITQLVWEYAKLPFFEAWIVSLPEISALVLSIIVYLALRSHEKARMFSMEVVGELAKVTYPLKKETVLSAVIVIVMVSIASVIVMGFDAAWGTLTNKFLTLK